MKSITAQAAFFALAIVSFTGCQSGMPWPFAKKAPPADMASSYAGAAAQGQPNIQLPSQGSQPYNVGNNYAPANTANAAPTGYGGMYPEAAAAAASPYPAANGAAGYGNASYPAGQGYPPGGVASSTPTGVYPSTGYSAAGQGVAPQEGPYGNPAATTAANPYATPGSAYGTAPNYGAAATNPYATTVNPYAAAATPPGASAYPDPAAQNPYGAYPQTAPGAPAAQTADTRSAAGYQRYDNAAPGSAYPESSAVPPGDGRYGAGAGTTPGSGYPPSANAYSYPNTSPPPAPSDAYRPGGTRDYVPATPGGSMPSSYGTTGSGVRPASYDMPSEGTAAPMASVPGMLQ